MRHSIPFTLPKTKIYFFIILAPKLKIFQQNRPLKLDLFNLNFGVFLEFQFKSDLLHGINFNVSHQKKRKQ